ncbi:MAG: DUF423 domain-containing protein [Geminicoccaceae bacterium]|nr:DUF423 domain-containing protein [Geminicoccaceae bacterium]
MQLGRDAWLGCVLALLAVGAGAFGAHGAGDERAAGLIETAARYQMWHALAMILVAIALPAARLPVFCFLGGVLAFSGTSMRWRWEHPPGGDARTARQPLAFMAGWALLALAFWRSRRTARMPDNSAGGDRSERPEPADAERSSSAASIQRGSAVRLSTTKSPTIRSSSTQGTPGDVLARATGGGAEAGDSPLAKRLATAGQVDQRRGQARRRPARPCHRQPCRPGSGRPPCSTGRALTGAAICSAVTQSPWRHPRRRPRPGPRPAGGRCRPGPSPARR